MNIKVEGFFCTSGHILSHTHVASCVRHLSGQHLMFGKDSRIIKSLKNSYLGIICNTGVIEHFCCPHVKNKLPVLLYCYLKSSPVG